jgi:hypothetical protein
VVSDQGKVLHWQPSLSSWGLFNDSSNLCHLKKELFFLEECSEVYEFFAVCGVAKCSESGSQEETHKKGRFQEHVH